MHAILFITILLEQGYAMRVYMCVSLETLHIQIYALYTVCLCSTVYFTVNAFRHLSNTRPKQLANIIFLNKLTMHWLKY